MCEHGLPGRHGEGRRTHAYARMGADMVGAFDFVDVDDVGIIQNRKMDGLAGYLGELHHRRMRCLDEVHPLNDVAAERPDLGREFISAVLRNLPHVALGLQRCQQAVDVAFGELQFGRKIRNAARLLAQCKRLQQTKSLDKRLIHSKAKIESVCSV
jgi:hypothetical protein